MGSREKSGHDSLLIKKDFSDIGQIVAVEISPFVLSQDLILIGFQGTILLAHLKIDDEEFDIDIIYETKINFRCTALSISPETTVSILPNNITFAATASDNFDIRVFKSDIHSLDCKLLSGHSSYVNDVKFDFDNNFLVSVSDDCTAKLWSTDEFIEIASFQLTSPGVVACWHKDDPCKKLLVGEKCGLIRFYNAETQTPIFSLDYGKPLSSAHWGSLEDAQLVASLQLGELLIWNLAKPCVPVANNLLFTEIGGDVKFSPFGELVAAVNPLDGNLKVVHSQNQQLKLSAAVTIPTNITWHSRLPIVCIGDYMKLCLWKVTSK